MSQPQFAWVPNALTTGRILFIPVIIAAILTFSTEKQFMSAPLILALFGIMIATDFLDGYFARKWNVTSNYGRMIDPIADKLFVAGLLITVLIVKSGAVLLLIPALIIIGRDIFISGLREHAALEGIVMPPTKLAKWKTATEMFALGALLIALTLLLGENLGEKIYLAGIVLLWIAALLSAFTGFKYARAALK